MKKLLVIISLCFFFSLNANAFSKKEFGDNCIDLTNETFIEQNIEITSQIAKRIKNNCKCQRKVFKTIPDKDWATFKEEKQFELFIQAVKMCAEG